MIKLLGIVLLGVILIGGCTINTTRTGFYYKDANTTTDNPITKSGFRNKSACFDWIDSQIKGNNKEDFECGTNCEYNIQLEVYRCDNTYDSR